MDFEIESARKDRLLNLFLQLEKSERERMAMARPRQYYERMFCGLAEVVSIKEKRVGLLRDTGERIKAFEVTPEISALLRKGDYLGMTAGLSQGMWRLISLDIVGTLLEKDGQLHLSMLNPSQRSLTTH